MKVEVTEVLESIKYPPVFEMIDQAEVVSNELGLVIPDKVRIMFSEVETEFGKLEVRAI